ncbi:MAG: TIM barrel protein [Propionibacteriales bacterium]|nr:TIM barrel protein [Propionibacteriales bacterium]
MPTVPRRGAVTELETLRRLAVSYYAAPPACSLETFCELLAHRGIGGIALTAAAVEDREPEELRRLLSTHNLTCTSLNSAGYFLHADPRRAAAQADLDARLLECAAAVDAPVNVIPGGIEHTRGEGGRPLPLEDARSRVEDALASLAGTASSAGVLLSLEPIHPLGLTDKGCVNQLSHARSLAAALPGCGITLDFFHSWWDADLAGTVASATEQLYVVQVCGVQTDGADPPRRTDMAKGDADVAGLLTALSAAGYPGLVEYEVFYQQRPQELDGLLDRAARDFVSLNGRPD